MTHYFFCKGELIKVPQWIIGCNHLASRFDELGLDEKIFTYSPDDSMDLKWGYFTRGDSFRYRMLSQKSEIDPSFIAVLLLHGVPLDFPE